MSLGSTENKMIFEFGGQWEIVDHILGMVYTRKICRPPISGMVLALLQVLQVNLHEYVLT